MHTQRGQSCVNVGVSERRSNGDTFVTNLELLPEETVYLIERGALDCRWTRTPGQLPESSDFSSCMPISVAQAYAQILGCDSCTLSRYQIYAYLKRLGYIVQRAVLVDKIRTPGIRTGPAPRRRLLRTMLLWIISRLTRWITSILYLFRLVARRIRSKPRGLLGIRPLDPYGTLYSPLTSQILSSKSSKLCQLDATLPRRRSKSTWLRSFMHGDQQQSLSVLSPRHPNFAFVCWKPTNTQCCMSVTSRRSFPMCHSVPLAMWMRQSSPRSGSKIVGHTANNAKFAPSQ